MIYFSSDWHLNHKNIMKYSNRPFSSIEEMNDNIIRNFFTSLENNSDVYYLGDLSFNLTTAESFLMSIPKNIRFHFIRGNHDKQLQDTLLKKYCTSVCNGYKDINYNGQKITLCHYPMYSWNCSHYGAWMLHGHHHSNTQDRFYGKIMNVGVDLHNFKPISFDEVKSFMDKREENWDMVKIDRK